MTTVTGAEKRGAGKSGVFVSHITEEAHIASKLKYHLEKALPDATAFVSSQDIRLGDDWRAALTKAVNKAEALVVLCSPRSIRRPWINFESGSGWARKRQVIPVCHSGLKKEALPAPLGNFQVLELVDGDDCRRLVTTLGATLGLEAAAGYDYQGMIESMFEAPPRGSDIGVLLTHSQDDWEQSRYTLFGLASRLPEKLKGPWSFTPVRKLDELRDFNRIHARAGLIVGSPHWRRMEPGEIDLLADFVMRGGRMLMLGFEFGDRHHGANFNDLAAKFGLYFEADIVGPPRERDEKDEQSGGEVNPPGQSEEVDKPYGVELDFEVSRGEGHELTAGLSSVRLANVQTLRTLPLAKEWLRVGRNAPCRPSRASVEYRNGFFTQPVGKDRVEPNWEAGWLPVAVEAPRGLCGDGAVQAIGTWDLLGRKTPFNHRDNLLLLGRLFNWLSHRPVTEPFEVEQSAED